MADAVARLGGLTEAMLVDLGSGPGTLTAELGRRLPALTVVGVEPNPRMLQMAQALAVTDNVRFRAGSAEHLPLASGSVDLVVSALSAHHWDDLAAAVAELRRVLKVGGCAWIYDVRFATYTDSELRVVSGRLGLPEDALRRWIPGSQGLVAALAVIGLSGQATTKPL